MHSSKGLVGSLALNNRTAQAKPANIALMLAMIKQMCRAEPKALM